MFAIFVWQHLIYLLVSFPYRIISIWNGNLRRREEKPIDLNFVNGNKVNIGFLAYVSHLKLLRNYIHAELGSWERFM